MKRKDTTRRIEAFFDGAIEWNPGGPIGAGVYIIDGDNERMRSISREPAPDNTVNVAEYLGVIELLEMLADCRACDIYINGDSRLVVNQLNGFWRALAGPYLPYYETAKKLLKELRRNNVVTVQWIPRECNAVADEFSREFLINEYSE